MILRFLLTLLACSSALIAGPLPFSVGHVGTTPFGPASVPGLVAWYDVSDALNSTYNPTTGVPGSGISVLRNKAVSSRTGNLLKYSEDFSNAAWMKTRVNAFGVTDTGAAGAGSFANTARTTDPLGGNAADFVQEDGTASNTHYIEEGSISLPAGVYTFACWIKQDGHQWVRLTLTDNGSNAGQVHLDLTNGQVGSNASAGVFSLSSGTIALHALGDTWYRCSLTTTLASALTVRARVQLLQNDSTSSYNGDNQHGLFLFGASLIRTADMTPVTGPTLAQGYYATTDVANDPVHDLLQSTAGSQPVLGRTDNKGNIFRYSDALDNAVWTKSNGGSGVLPIVTAGATDPDGGSTAYRMQFNLGGGTTTASWSWVTQPFYSGTDAMIQSVWLKSNTSNSYTMIFRNGDNGLTGFTVTPVWTQFSVTGLNLASTSFHALGLRGGLTPTNSDTADVLVWHPSLRNLSWASDYISTTAAPIIAGANGLALARCDGVDDFLKTLQFPLPQPYTVFLVARPVTWTANDRLIDGFTDTSGEVKQRTASPNLAMSAGGTPVESSALALGQLGILTMVLNGAGSIFGVGNTETTGSAGTTSANGLTLAAIGTAVNSFANSDYGEVIIYNRTPSSSERQAIRVYLARRYALPL